MALQRLISPLIISLVIGFASSQYEQGRGSYSHDNQPPANILLHKQALGQDGSFNYAFAADNGLQQGEVINPDGSRKGSYSYVDPNGKTVSLSYTAGKDGFRVLNGDHLPKAPQPQHPPPNPPQQYYQPHPQQYPQPYSQPPQQQPPSYPLFRPNPVPYEAYRSAPTAPAYRPNPIPQQELYQQPQHHPQYRPQPAHYETPYRRPPLAPHHRPRPYSVQEPAYDNPSSSHYIPQQFKSEYRQEEPNRPHSFGNGYSFEFAG